MEVFSFLKIREEHKIEPALKVRFFSKLWRP
jgi:hypothetical protein